jgi:hypothetical protein
MWPGGRAQMRVHNISLHWLEYGVGCSLARSDTLHCLYGLRYGSLGFGAFGSNSLTCAWRCDPKHRLVPANGLRTLCPEHMTRSSKRGGSQHETWLAVVALIALLGVRSHRTRSTKSVVLPAGGRCASAQTAFAGCEQWSILGCPSSCRGSTPVASPLHDHRGRPRTESPFLPANLRAGSESI